MWLPVVLFFTFLSIRYVDFYATEHNCDICSYRTKYNNQSWLNKQFVKKVKNEKTPAVTIKLFFGLKADSNAIDEKGKTAFSYLFGYHNPSLEKIKLFLKHNVDCNKTSVVAGNCVKKESHLATKTCYPLEYISGEIHNMDLIIPIIKLLLKHNADPNNSSMPVHYGANKTTLLNDVLNHAQYYDCKHESSISLIKTILDYKADVNTADSKYGNTPFHSLCINSNYNVLIKYFLEARGNANIKNHTGATPFEHFVYSCKLNFSKKSLIFTVSENNDILNAFIEHQADLTFLLEQSLKEYKNYRDDEVENRHLNKKKAIKFIFSLLENKADLNAIKNREDIYFYKSFTPEIVQSFLNYKMDPTVHCRNSFNQIMFGYEWTLNKDKRNMFAYAIPFYIQKKYVQEWKTLLLCLNAKKKICPVFNIPRYLRIPLCGAIAVKINQVLKGIQKIENDEHWPGDSESVIALKYNICKLINLHNDVMSKINL